MVQRDVILGKINSIQNSLQRIHQTVDGDLDRLQDINVQDVVVLNLQRAIQQVIHIASYVVINKQLGIPETFKDTFRILQKNSILEPALAAKMEKIVGFRNIAVQNYEELSIDILRSIISNHLKDIEDFYSTILNQYK